MGDMAKIPVSAQKLFYRSDFLAQNEPIIEI